MSKTLILSIAFLCAFNHLGFAQQEPLFTKSTTNQEWVVVDKVIRADFFILKTGERIQLIGLEAPEVPKEYRRALENNSQLPATTDDPTTSLEKQSFLFSKELLQGKKVRLEFDVQKKNEDWDTLAYVYLDDGMFVNVEILRQGYSYLRIRPPNMKYADEFRKAYQEAKRELRGFQGE